MVNLVVGSGVAEHLWPSPPARVNCASAIATSRPRWSSVSRQALASNRDRRAHHIMLLGTGNSRPVIGNSSRSEEKRMGRVQGQVAVVTGAAKGIGRAIAQRLAEEGAAVALGDIDAAELKRTADSIAAA